MGGDRNRARVDAKGRLRFPFAQAQGGQPPLGMVAKPARAVDHRRSLCLEGRQGESRPHLGRRHIEHDLGAGEVPAPDRDRSPAASGLGSRSQPAERLSDPLHGAPSQGGVTGQSHLERSPGNGTGQEAERRCRIGGIDGPLGWRPSRNARRSHERRSDVDAQRPESGDHGSHIPPETEIVDLAQAFGHRRHDQGPVRQRLVSGHFHLGTKTTRRRHDPAGDHAVMIPFRREPVPRPS